MTKVLVFVSAGTKKMCFFTESESRSLWKKSCLSQIEQTNMTTLLPVIIFH